LQTNITGYIYENTTPASKVICVGYRSTNLYFSVLFLLKATVKI